MLLPDEQEEFDGLCKCKGGYTIEKYNRYLELYKKSLKGLTAFNRTAQGIPYGSYND